MNNDETDIDRHDKKVREFMENEAILCFMDFGGI